ncbi:MAG: cell division protein FtsH [Bacteroidetes bacterium CG23_combo_of_CG06-09_8_20_14_all_32_9]|nr:MAG: cell division protein FtsH [Bacteroidetes bacterium CG23_combo_of_CG06-09_8_20_14_all_32_9]
MEEENKKIPKEKENIKEIPKEENNTIKKTKNKPKFSIYWFYALILLVFLGLNFFDFNSKKEEIEWQNIVDIVNRNEVKKIIIVNREEVEIYLTDDALKTGKYKRFREKSFSSGGPQFYYTILSIEHFQQNIEKLQSDISPENKVEIKTEKRKNIFGDLLTWLLPVIVIILIWMFVFRKMAGRAGGGPGGIFSIGKSKAKIFDKDTSNVKIDFKDVAGLEEAKIEIREIVDFLKNPKKYTELGGKIPKGALLIGPPGTGKTLLAKAVAGEANVPFFSMSGSDFVEMFVGVGASRVRDLFKQAKEKAPCIVFIDEIDAIGRSRNRNPNFGANDERENTLNQLLTEMDGFDSNTGVIILAATNRADMLDHALVRAGRFDRQIHVELPDLNERRDIFKVHLKPIKIDKNLDIEFLAKQTPGFSGADIANVCNEAALIAARKERKKVEKQDFLDAIDRIIGGLEKRTKIITIKEKKTIAYHEAGHAAISWLLEYASPLVKVTIIPRGKSLGAAWYLPEERQITTFEQIMDELCATLGGRASEEITFGKISTGALNDLEKVSKQTYALVSFFGMSQEIGNVSFYDSSGQSDFAFSKPYSEKTSQTIDAEVKKIIEGQYIRAKKILSENKEKLNKLGELLLEKEVIFSDDLEAIFGKRPFVTDEIVVNNISKEKKQTENAELINSENKDLQTVPAMTDSKKKKKQKSSTN